MIDRDIVMNEMKVKSLNFSLWDTETQENIVIYHL